MTKELNKGPAGDGTPLRVALQFPEGLMIYACLICDLLANFTGCETVINADVTYGACCVDDLTAQRMGAHFVIHYAHSCLVPIGDMNLKALYVFVDIMIDLDHFVETIKLNFELPSQSTFYLMATIQFNNSIFAAQERLKMLGYEVLIPQERPRCKGETLGCTAPVVELDRTDTVVYLCDGRFHMEAVMIANPKAKFLQYNPYTKQFTQEQYDFPLMISNRGGQLEACPSPAEKPTVGVIMGVLGRQGSRHILDRILKELRDKEINYVPILLSEVFPDQL